MNRTSITVLTVQRSTVELWGHRKKRTRTFDSYIATEFTAQPVIPTNGTFLKYTTTSYIF